MARRPSSGTWAWLALSAYVLLYDTWAMTRDGTTLSTVFRESSRHPFLKWVVIPAWCVTSLHLFGLLPPHLDPFNLHALVLAKVRNN